jgi:hypothetical protein
MTDVCERFYARYGARPTIRDIGWWRAEVYEEAEAACTKLEEAEAEKRGRTVVAARLSDFDQLLEDVREIDRVTSRYLNDRDERWRRLLRAAYGYVPR